MTGRAALAAAALVASALAAMPAAAYARGLQLDDLRAIVGVSSSAISPDGKRAVVVVTRTVWNDDRYERDLDLIDLASHARRTLTFARKGLGSPAFSPDGTRIAFVADQGSGDDAKSQVFVLPLDGGDPKPVTAAREGVDQFIWRPDGLALAYTAEDSKPKRTGADRFRDAFTFTTEPITARSRPRSVHLWVQPLDGEKARQLTSGASSVATAENASTISWSPDGSAIAFTCVPNAINNDAYRAHVDLVDVATGALRQLTSHGGFESDPHFAPDGKHVAFLRSAGDNQINPSEAFAAPATGGDGTPLSRPFDRYVHDVGWSADSSALLFVAHDATHNALVRAPLDGAAPSRLDIAGLVVTSPLDGAIARDGAMVFVGTRTREPSELWYKASPETAPVMVTGYNAGLAKLDLAASEAIAFPTSLGIDGDAVLLEPAGFVEGRKYPLALVIHGGPTSASTEAFDRLGQLMASRGWLVLEPNYRGSDNLGAAYQRAVRYDPDEGPGKDVMAAVDAVRARGIVDDRRIAVSGWSYGGIMTAWMISKYHIWRAAVSGASVNDWITDYGTADDSDADMALMHGSPFVGDNAAEYRRVSAITYARDVTTPTLILSDIGDNRDPFATSAMYYRALRDNKKDVTLVAWPIDGHFPRDPVRTADVYEHWIGYIAQHFR